jgi:pre-mRNA-processing factor SLU7
LTHDAKTCTDRPRKVGAKYSQRDFGNDEIIAAANEGRLNYEAKRDRWNGYDANAFRHVIDEWNETNEEQKKRRDLEL